MDKIKHWLYYNTWKQFPPVWVAVLTTIILLAFTVFTGRWMSYIEMRRIPPTEYIYDQQKIFLDSPDFAKFHNCTDKIDMDILPNENNTFYIQFTCRQILHPIIEDYHLSSFMYIVYGIPVTFTFILCAFTFLFCVVCFLPGSIQQQYTAWKKGRMPSVSYV